MNVLKDTEIMSPENPEWTFLTHFLDLIKFLVTLYIIEN